MLRFNMENDAKDKGLLVDILKKNCQRFALITHRDAAQGKRLDYAYHIKMKRGRDKGELVDALNAITHIRGVSLLLQETTVEL